VERPLRREVVYCTIASRPCQSNHSGVQVPQNSDHILLSHLRLPQPGGPGPHIHIPQEQGAPVIPLGTGFPFCHLLRLTGLQWRYSNPPLNGSQHMSKKSKSCYDWQSSWPWNLWPDIIFCPKVAVLSLWGALSDERLGLSPVSHCQQCLVHCQGVNNFFVNVSENSLTKQADL
jgi:hypothetical protein